MGDNFFDENKHFNFGKTFERVWKPHLETAIKESMDKVLESFKHLMR